MTKRVIVASVLGEEEKSAHGYRYHMSQVNIVLFTEIKKTHTHKKIIISIEITIIIPVIEILMIIKQSMNVVQSPLFKIAPYFL